MMSKLLSEITRLHTEGKYVFAIDTMGELLTEDLPEAQSTIYHVSTIDNALHIIEVIRNNMDGEHARDSALVISNIDVLCSKRQLEHIRQAENPLLNVAPPTTQDAMKYHSMVLFRRKELFSACDILRHLGMEVVILEDTTHGNQVR